MILGFEETKKILANYKIPFAKSFLARNEKEAQKYAKIIGYPVVLKIVSPDILHRTDIGGVITDIREEKSLIDAWEKINQLAVAKKAQILIQKMEQGGEIIAGAKIDPVFGPVLMFGLGGIFVEAFQDISFRLSPITQKDAQEMIREIKGFKILTGFRGREKANLKEIEKIMLNVSELISKESIKEIDLNPIMVNKKRAVACDVKIIV